MNEFPFNFSNLASVGDVIRAERVNGADYIIGTVTEKSPSAFWVGVTETSEASVLGKQVRVPYGLCVDWPNRVTLVSAAPGSNRAIENLSKALDGAKQMIDGMLQRDEIHQREIAELRKEVKGLQMNLSSSRRTLAVMIEHRDLMERRAKTTEMVMKQRDEALRELAAMRGERNRLREQVEQLHESREKIIKDRDFLIDKLQEAADRATKAEDAYRDLRARMLEAPKA